VWSVREKNVLRERKTSYASHKQANRGNLTYYSPLQSDCGVGGGGGGGGRPQPNRGNHTCNILACWGGVVGGASYR